MKPLPVRGNGTSIVPGEKPGNAGLLRSVQSAHLESAPVVAAARDLIGKLRAIPNILAVPDAERDALRKQITDILQSSDAPVLKDAAPVPGGKKLIPSMGSVSPYMELTTWRTRLADVDWIMYARYGC